RPPTGEGYRLSRRGRKERTDRAPGKIDCVHAAGKDQVFAGLGPIGSAAIAELAREALLGFPSGRGKTVRSEAAEKLMEVGIVNEQPAPRVVIVPAFVAWLRVVDAEDVESSAISITHELGRLRPEERSALHRRALPRPEIDLLSVEVGSLDHADARLEALKQRTSL